MRKIYYYAFVILIFSALIAPGNSEAQSSSNPNQSRKKDYSTKNLIKHKTVKKPLRTLNEYQCTFIDPIPAGIDLFLLGDEGSDEGTPFGYVVGTNTFEDKQKANYFDFSSSPFTELTDLVFAAYVKVLDSSKAVTVRVFDGTTGEPGTELGSKPVTLRELAEAYADLTLVYVDVQFDAPILLPASKKVFISIDFSNLSIEVGNDEFFGIPSTDFEAPYNIAWEQWSDNSWHPFDDPDGWGTNLIIELYPLICGDIPLPITLNSFSAKSFGSANKIIWETQTESNNKGFEIQRSEDGVNFTTIAFISSNAMNGNSNSRLNYSFIDESPFASTNYYRIKQVDINQKINFSKVLLVKRAGLRKQGILSTYPNPTRDLLNVVLDLPAGRSNTVSITDMVGRILMQKKVEGSNTNQNLQFNVSRLPRGTYVLKTQSEEGLKMVKFVKE